MDVSLSQHCEFQGFDVISVGSHKATIIQTSISPSISQISKKAISNATKTHAKQSVPRVRKVSQKIIKQTAALCTQSCHVNVKGHVFSFLISFYHSKRPLFSTFLGSFFLNVFLLPCPLFPSDFTFTGGRCFLAARGAWIGGGGGSN